MISPSARTPGFEGDLERAAQERGLRLDGAVYASVAAALAGDRHVVLVGPPGAGKTSLALAVAKAAVDAGKADGAMLAAGGDEALATHVVTAARRNRWLVVDDLRDAAALAPLAAFLGHLPVTLRRRRGAAGTGRLARDRDRRRAAVRRARRAPELLRVRDRDRASRPRSGDRRRGRR